jgi:DNA-binding MarR family transcriptional regulator
MTKGARKQKVVSGRTRQRSTDVTVTIPSLVHTGHDADFGEMISLMYASLARLQTMRRTLAKFLHLSSSEFAVIITLLRADHGGAGLRIGRIAGELHVAAANVTATVARLERIGWLTKSPDPNDSRAVAVRLTNQGHARLGLLADKLHVVNDLWFKGMTKAEFKAVVSFFRRLVRQYPPALNAARGLGRVSRRRTRDRK